MTARRGLRVISRGLEHRIHVIRGEKVMLDSDLAALYAVSARRLNEQVKRNRRRFPSDFMFQLTTDEAASLRSQIATLNSGRGRHRKYAPYAFTEHGAVMLASVLNSPAAVHASLQVVRAFVRLRAALGAHTVLARKLRELEHRYDGQFTVIFEALRQLMAPAMPTTRRQIGFRSNRDSRHNH